MRNTVFALALALAGCGSSPLDIDTGADLEPAPDMAGEWAILAPFPLYDDLSPYSMPDADTPAFPLVTLSLGAQAITVGIDYQKRDGSRGWSIVDESPNDCTTKVSQVVCTVLGERATFSPRHNGWEGESVTITTPAGDTTVVSLEEAAASPQG